MRSGQLNKRVTFERQTNVPDGMGGFAVTWVTHAADVWAAIWPVSSKEMIASQREIGTITHKVRIRHRSGMAGNMRVKYGSRYFNILGPPINVGSENRELDLICKEVA